MDKDYDRFIKALTAEAEKQLGKGYTVFRQDTVKNNGAICRCICISKHGYAVSPCYRTDTFYELYRGLEDVRVIAIQGGVENMRNMVREINASELPEEEVLSDEVYYYDREMKKLLTAE